MPRVSKVDACMLCEEVPCVCGGPPKKAAKRTPKAKAVPTPEPTTDPVETVALQKPKLSIREAMKAAAAAEPVQRTQPREPKRETVRKQQMAVEPEQAVFAAALRALAPVLHPNELDKYRMIVTSEPSSAERAVVWRARHGK